MFNRWELGLCGQCRRRDACLAAQAPDDFSAEGVHESSQAVFCTAAAVTQVGRRDELRRRDPLGGVKHAGISPVVVVIQGKDVAFFHLFELLFRLENHIDPFTPAGNFQFLGLGKGGKFIGDITGPPQQLSMPRADRRGDRLGECEA